MYQVSGFHLYVDLDRALRLRLPRLQLEPLVVAEQHQLVALRDDADVAHLAAALERAHVGLDGVVAESVGAEERRGSAWRTRTGSRRA